MGHASTYVVVAHENPNHDYIDIERGLNKKRHTYIQTLFAASLLEADWTNQLAALGSRYISRLNFWYAILTKNEQKINILSIFSLENISDSDFSFIFWRIEDTVIWFRD